jgi:hypothetical protein
VGKKPDIDADWQARAVQACIKAARDVVSPDGVNPRAAIGGLSDVEWGWLVAAIVFSWISTRATQAVAEGMDTETSIRSQHNQDPPAWVAGAIETILPTLGQMTLPWSNSIGSWPKGSMVKFCHRVWQLSNEAIESRDKGAQDKIVRKLSADEMSREASAAAGGSLMTAEEKWEAPIFDQMTKLGGDDERGMFAPLRARDWPDGGDTIPF